jgi:hypothetical protein
MSANRAPTPQAKLARAQFEPTPTASATDPNTGGQDDPPGDPQNKDDELVYDSDPSGKDSITYEGSWTHAKGTPQVVRALNGTLSWTDVSASNPTPRAVFTFPAASKAVSLIYSLGPDRGEMRIFINGKEKGTFSNQAPEYRRQVVRTWTLTPQTKPQILVVEALSGRIDVDAFVINIDRISRPETYDANYSLLKYIKPADGTIDWTDMSVREGSHVLSAAFGSNIAGAVMRVTFESSAPNVTLLTRGHPQGGIATVTVDGVDMGTINTHDPAATPQRAFSVPLPAGHTIHTLTVMATGREPNGQVGPNSWVVIEGLTVH